MSLSLSLVQQAHDHVDQYPGWDKDQIVMLAVRSKVAREFHEMLFAQINQTHSGRHSGKPNAQSGAKPAHRGATNLWQTKKKKPPPRNSKRKSGRLEVPRKSET